jgi:hypothetical protein
MLPRAVLDANVLAVEVVRDFMLSLAEQECFAPVWSKPLGVELRRALCRMRTEEAVAYRMWELMNRAFPLAEAEIPKASYDVPGIKDPDDQHVAVLARETEYLVTFNLKDFPSSIGKASVLSPDAFAVQILEGQWSRALQALDRMQRRRTLTQPSRDELISALAQNRLPRTAAQLNRLGGHYEQLVTGN